MRMVLLSAGLCALAAGCATIMAPRDTVTVNSEPAGIEFALDGVRMKTPAELHLSRRTCHYLVFADGTQLLVDQSHSGDNPWVWGDIGLMFVGILPGFVALLIDVFSSAAINLYPDEIFWMDGAVYAGKGGRMLTCAPPMAAAAGGSPGSKPGEHGK